MTANTISKEEIKARYSPEGLPPVSNPFLYAYRCIIKNLFYVIFGVGSILIVTASFPFIRLSSKNNEEFGIKARRFISHVFRVFLFFLSVLQGAKLKTENRAEYRNMHKKIIVANHPSILDFVYIMSMVPNATCIVSEHLAKTPFVAIVKYAYILNSTDFETVCRECKKLIDQGCNVIIFPEGTRTPRHGRNVYKKGAVRIALYCGCDIQPIFIGGSDKYGLGKHDIIWSYNPVEQYLYDFKLLPEIKIAPYTELSAPVAAKRLIDKVENTIIDAARQYSAYHPLCKTLNNY